ncbi:MAG: aminotransferase class V-fold PLP-dependent enzyme [Cellulomonadaceae bacterium]|jgi:O-acetylhomoserine (thiol)-lyase|nr:aminotransferase class V-fold PLP-dependent enzyme [Cellulomonadaceae bacterium]
MTSNYRFDTRQVHAGQVSDPETGATSIPIYQSAAFEFPSVEAAQKRFALAELGPIYTRLGNPTTQVVEDRLANLDGGVGALLTASGAAAVYMTIHNLAEAGDHIVSSPELYGGTFNQFAHTLPKQGIEVEFVEDPHDLDQWRAAIRPNTKAFFFEAIPNPLTKVHDVQAIADIAHEAGIPVIVDNTIATPYLHRPIEHGADFVVYSATKFLQGHGVGIAGAIIDGGTFDFAKQPERFPNYNEPDESYHGLVYARDLGVGGVFGVNLAFILKARVQGLRDMGSSISPFNAWLLAQGLETLSLRMDRHVGSAFAVAKYLEAHPAVSKVHYAGLEGNEFHALATKYAPLGPGAVLGFELDAPTPEAARAAGEAFIAGLELHLHVANIGDARSLAIHPASTTHSQLSPEQLELAGISAGFVRLSPGLEHQDDIIEDVEKGIVAAQAALAA